MAARKILLASVALLALGACGQKEAGSAAPKPTSAAAAKLSAESPVDQPFRLADAEALDVDALFALLPDALRPSYDDATFDAKSGATVLTKVKFPDSALGDELNFDGLTIERAELYGVDLEAIDAVKDATAVDLDASFATVLRKARLFGVASSDGEDAGSMRIGAIEIDALGVRPSALPEQAEASPLAAFFNGFELGGLYFKDAVLDGAVTQLAAEDDAGEALGTGLALSLADFRLVGVGGGRLGAILANDIEYRVLQSEAALAEAGGALGPQAALFMKGPLKNLIAPGEQTSRVKSIEWRDIDFSGLMAFGLRNEKPPYEARNLIGMGPMRVVDAETLINGKRFSFVPLTTVSEIEFDWLAPSKVRAASEKGVYDFTAYLEDGDEKALGVLKEYGLDKIEAGSHFSYDWDAEKGGARIASDFLAPKLADLNFSLALGGLNLDAIAAATASGGDDAVAGIAAFESMEISVRETALLDAFYALAALQTGGEPETVRQSTPALLQLGGLQLRAINPRFGDYIDALGGFLEDGGSLTISAKPEAPMTLAEIAAKTDGAPQNAPDVLNLSIVHATKKK